MNYTKPDRNLRQSLVYSKSPPYTAISVSWYAHVSRASDVCIAACVSRPVTEKDTALLVNPDNSAWQLGQVSRLGATRTRLQLRRDGGNKVCVCESKRCVQKTLTEKDFGPWRARGKTVSRSGPGERGFNQRSPDRWVCRCLINCICISSALPRAGQEENFLYTFYRGRKRRFSSY